MNAVKSRYRSLSRFNHLGSNKWAKLSQSQTIENDSAQLIVKRASFALVAIALIIVGLLLLPI